MPQKVRHSRWCSEPHRPPKKFNALRTVAGTLKVSQISTVYGMSRPTAPFVGASRIVAARPVLSTTAKTRIPCRCPTELLQSAYFLLMVLKLVAKCSGSARVWVGRPGRGSNGTLPVLETRAEMGGICPLRSLARSLLKLFFRVEIRTKKERFGVFQ